MAQLFIMPFWPVVNGSGDAISAFKVWFTAAGTNVPALVYADADLTVPLANPVFNDGSGRLSDPVYLDDDVQYRIRVYESGDTVGLDTPLEEYDPYSHNAILAGF